MESVTKRVLAGLAIFLGMFMVLGVVAIYPAWKYKSVQKETLSTVNEHDYYLEDYCTAIDRINELLVENTSIKQENLSLKQQLADISSAVDSQAKVSSMVGVTDKAEKLANQIAIDFMVRDSLRDKIIYEDYSPVTNEQNYCENSKVAKDILSRSGNPNGTVYALTEYDKNGYFIVFGKSILGNQTLMSEAVIHEMTHVYCAAKNLDQGPDEHSAYYKTYYQRIWDYAYYKYPDLL